MALPDHSLIEVQTITLSNQTQEAAYFGFELPYLPDFLLDHTLLGTSNSERLNEVFGRFERLIVGLRKYQGVAYSLRYSTRHDQGAIDMAILARVIAPVGKGTERARQVAADFALHLSSYGFEHHRPLPLNAVENGQNLSALLHPPYSPLALVEIRQHETVVPFLTIGDKAAYVIHPFWGAVGSSLEPFESMLSQPSPVIVSIYLEPTELSEEEYNSIAESSYYAQTYADFNQVTYSETSISRRRDPNAELVGRIFTAYLKSLSEPFLLNVQVASPNPNSAWSVARSFASAFTIHDRHGSNQEAERDLPSAADLFAPASNAQAAAAFNAFHYLIFTPWGESQAPPVKQRLPYLVGSSGASAAFRFPVSVRGGVPGIAVKQTPPGFEPGARPDAASNGEVHIGNYHRGGAAVAPLKDLTRHTLITGFTGSGKTNTVLYLLNQIWTRYHIPFLVIELAKKEYRALARLKGFGDLLIFTLGDETTSPFRLNPFELLPNLRLEAHLGRLQACFDAALPQFGILPSIIAEAMESIYQVKDWALTDRASEAEERLFPTMRDLNTQVIRVAETRGYAGETYQNIRAAASGRIGSLLRGSKGRMLGGLHSFPADLIFTRPVILEMNDLNEDDKALIMMFLLTWLREYREQHPLAQLQHLTVVEEAHNVLSNVQPVGSTEIAADTKAKAVAAFANMLAEVRSLGEGLIISDQSPEKLAPDAMRNTNLQIAHQLRDRRDREAVARAMIMDEAQQEYVGKLRVGEAAYFRTGIEKATFISVPEFKDLSGFDQPLTDAEVKERMQAFQQEHLEAFLPFDGCRFCSSPCDYRERIEPQTFDQEVHEHFLQATLRFETNPKPEDWPGNWLEVARVCQEASSLAGVPDQLDASYCFLAHEIDFKFTPAMREAFERAYGQLMG